MSYRSRQKKARSQSAKRRDANKSQPDRWYLTIGTRSCGCGEPGCDSQLRSGGEVVYRHEPQQVLCVPCADRQGIKYRPSLRWEESRGRRQSSGSRPRAPQSSEPRARAIVIPTRAEIEAAATHTRDQLAEWGVTWPPPKGWRRRLLRAADKIAQSDGPTIWTDGACLGNPGPGGWAIVVERDGKQTETRAGGAAKTTNNAMELRAVLAALEIAEPGTRIVSDSTYAVNGLTSWLEGWKSGGWLTKGKTEVANRELWEQLDRAFDRDAVDVSWVKGHAGSHFNELADELATAEAKAAIPSSPAVVAVGSSAPGGDAPAGPVTAITTAPSADRKLSGEEKRWAAEMLERVRSIPSDQAVAP